MKKINLFLCSALVVGASFFSGCTKDTSTGGPSISFTNGQESATVTSSTWSVTGTITSDVGLSTVKFFSVIGSTETQISSVTSFDDKNNYLFQINVTNITQNMQLKVQATDKNDVTNAKSFTINFGSTTEKLNFWTGTLAAKLGAQGSTTGSSLATSNGQVYSKTQAASYSNLIDFIYYYGGTVNAQIMSPSYANQTGVYQTYVSGWNTLNATQFGTSSSVSTADFDAITKTDDTPVVNAATLSIVSDRAGNLAQGNVYAFITAAGKKGLFKVVTVSGTDAGYVTIEVKVQK